MQVARGGIAALVNRVHRDHLPVGKDVIAVFGAALTGDYFEQTSDIGGIGGHAIVGGGLIIALTIGPVTECAAALGSTDALG